MQKSMNEKLVYICGLMHTRQSDFVNLVPYAIGCIKSYFHSHSVFGKDVKIKLINNPENLNKNFFVEHPGVVAFSNYIWNSRLSYAFAQQIKKSAPCTLIVFGGPNYPLEDNMRERWLSERPDIDFYVIGEGEQPFTELLDRWYTHGDLSKLKAEGVAGCHTLVDGRLRKGEDSMPRLSDLNTFLSPYLMGYLDEFLDSAKNIPLVEAARGCPFTCAFCVNGSSTWKRIMRKSPEVFEREIELIASKTKSKSLFLSDSNFGMYPQDIEIAHILKKAQDQWGYPLNIMGTTGKNAENNILKCVEILGGSMHLSASVQSLDPEVLTNIKRQNISVEKLISIGKYAHSKDSITRSEIILALPGDTKEKHFSTTYKLLDAGMDRITPYTLMMLDGSELNTAVFRNNYSMKTKYRLFNRGYGTYPFGGVTISSGEIEEVVVGLEKMTFRDYLDCRSFDLTVSIFYSDDILFELLQFLKIFGIKASVFVAAIHKKKDAIISKELVALYQSFEKDTIRELWDDKDDLASILSRDGGEEIRGRVIDYNILYKHRAMAFCYHVEDISRLALLVAREMLPEKAQCEYREYLDELLTFNLLKKNDPFEYKRSFSHAFNFNFDELEQARFKTLPVRLNRKKILTFYRSEDQIAALSGIPAGIEGAISAIYHFQIPKMFRLVR